MKSKNSKLYECLARMVPVSDVEDLFSLLILGFGVGGTIVVVSQLDFGSGVEGVPVAVPLAVALSTPRVPSSLMLTVSSSGTPIRA